MFYYVDSNGALQNTTLTSGGKVEYWNYTNGNHVEGKAAQFMRANNVSDGVVFHNHPDGTCNFCLNMTERLLPENAKLTVIPPEGATLQPGKGGTGKPTTFIEDTLNVRSSF